MQPLRRLSSLASHLTQRTMSTDALAQGPKELQNKGLVFLVAQTPNGQPRRFMIPAVDRLTSC